MEWDEYLDDGAFYRKALDLLISGDNEFDPEPYEPREDDRYDDDDDDEEEEEYDNYDEEEEDGDRYDEREEDDEDDEYDENEEEDDEDDSKGNVNEEEYNEEEEARAFHEAVKKQKEEWQRQMPGDGLPESIFYEKPSTSNETDRRFIAFTV